MQHSDSPSLPSDVAFLAEINSLARGGIRADRRNLIEDIGAQFADPREWIREYVVNAYDAGATWCRVGGRETADTLTVTVDDNGHGMDEAGLRDFMTLFRSVKRSDIDLPVGRFGIGKASIIAIPGLRGFALQTSTGSEAWKLATGALQDEAPVRLIRFTPVPPRGTSFAITFAKANSLAAEMEALEKVLAKYLRYLPLSISLLRRTQAREGEALLSLQPLVTTGHREQFSRRFSFTLEGRRYLALLGIGAPAHELYQNRVLITDSYDLLNHGVRSTEPRLSLPRLHLRLDSPDFELPFGRHRLRHDQVLVAVARHLRQRIVPDYYSELCLYLQGDGFAAEEIGEEEFDSFTCGLLRHSAVSPRQWTAVPLFRGEEGGRYSLDELRALVGGGGALYIAGEDDPGADYRIFSGPVLSRRQPPGARSLLEKLFAADLVDLADRELIIEAPAMSHHELPAHVRQFEGYIGFHPWSDPEAEGGSSKALCSASPPPLPAGLDGKSLDALLATMGKEAKKSREKLEGLGWRLNYLVRHDGRTPSITHRFIVVKNTVVLNLHHPEVQDLLRLAERLPDLAGHWSLAMCLAEGNMVLPHLTNTAREELIRQDAISRCLAHGRPREALEVRRTNEARRLLRSFIDGMLPEAPGNRTGQ